MNKKLRKFIKNPIKYFCDMASNILLKIDMMEHNKKTRASILLKKKKGYEKYSIVSACYNAGAYIDDYFESLIRQRLDFKKNIFCIMVDDGSEDNTACRILEWQKKYPNNIKYIHKTNGGAASARNVGLQFISTKWVTFIDPDDFVNSDYFYNIDCYLAKTNGEEISTICTNIVFYNEESRKFQNRHPLKNKFNKKINVVTNPLEDNSNIQLSASSAIFRSSIIACNKIKFKTDIRPNFEDAHFICRYIYSSSNMSMVYLKGSRYYYRKRSSKNSLIDTSWKKQEKYYDILKFGLLDILEKYKKSKYLCNIVLYEIFWYVKYIVNAPERISFLDDSQKNTFINLIDNIFEYISESDILDFNLAGCNHYHRVGMLNCFKSVQLECNNIIYVEQIDFIKNEIKIKYFTGVVEGEEFFWGDNQFYPSHKKIVADDFCGRIFVHQILVWLPLSNKDNMVLRCKLNRYNAIVKCKNKIIEFPTVSNLKKILAKFCKYNPASHWVLMDRNSQADDNAEHLYRWIMTKHPERKIYFVLNRESHDWERLNSEGFNLIAFDSREHKSKLKSCSKIISSHIDNYVVNYFRDNSTAHIPVVFLQHGVTKDDLSRWLNTKKRIDLFVTATKQEYSSIVNNESRYQYTDKEVKLLGFPRHDALLNFAKPKKEILIMPTWRQYLAGKVINGNIREDNPNFMQSEYAKKWRDVLISNKLFEIVSKYGFHIVFFPHENVQQYLKYFDIPQYINIMRHCDCSIQKLFQEASILVTDYSSVAFEFAYLRKAIIYYQFDEKEFFCGDHVYQKGYYDYRKNGFGSVVTEKEKLIEEIHSILNNKCIPSNKYYKRMDEFFEFRDGRCCERVYNAICDLDNPDS